MKCNIIQDLLPSYIDGVCSKETASEVETHIKDCVQCNKTMQMMQQPTQYIVEPNVEEAKEPFKRINKKRRIQVIAASLLTFLIMIISYQVVQNVGVVNQFFFPMAHGIVNITDDGEEWKSLNFNEENYLIYDRVFWKKSIVNSGSESIDSGSEMESDILIRVKDINGKVVVDDIQVKSGKSVKLDGLKKNEKYFFEIKAPQGRYFINAI
ncbi:zf-HC2 domain-containing protein [Sporosarcina sp.]|uniref:zf-HC2 domain-containing protein n=1 Tax=Sporosarcina sp. TaxID=49982 RepID=UPI00262036C0|nr:zf-HC2 domain-containing protein [Sporosarcina sp.]